MTISPQQKVKALAKVDSLFLICKNPKKKKKERKKERKKNEIQVKVGTESKDRNYKSLKQYKPMSCELLDSCEAPDLFLLLDVSEIIQ